MDDGYQFKIIKFKKMSKYINKRWTEYNNLKNILTQAEQKKVCEMSHGQSSLNKVFIYFFVCTEVRVTHIERSAVANHHYLAFRLTAVVIVMSV